MIFFDYCMPRGFPPQGELRQYLDAAKAEFAKAMETPVAERTEAFVLELLSNGVAPEEIVEEFAPFPKECIPEVLKFAALKVAGREPNVAA